MAREGTIPEAIKEGGENVPVIQSLTDRAQGLSASIDRWNSAYIWLVAATVFLGALVFIAQFVVIKNSKNLSTLQSDLLHAKDVQLASDLKAKDVEINKAKAEAASATEKTEALHLDVAKANRRVAEAEQKTEELRKRNLETEVALEQEKKERIAIEHTLRRRITGFSLRNGKSNVDPLKVFGAIDVYLEIFPDQEAMLAAGQMRVS